ncbi:MAG: septum formation protein Maf [Chlorobiaceae bacterium]|nr:septum formation protein Maf [Chlorobiaceae bacterium]NTW10829.1 septum formation protein Maf [Chlorobiaceae bacterium]
MQKPLLILASQSPRRQEILSLALIPFETVSVDTPELFVPGFSIEENVRRIALEKAEAAAATKSLLNRETIILTADTVVVRDGEVLGKPVGCSQALSMLQSLQNRMHTVCTGFALLSGEESYTECVTTSVEFLPMTDEEIMRYLDTVKPYDKAGSYGIQDPLMACHIKRIEGCYYNVVGLPLSSVCNALKRFMQAYPAIP